MKTRIISLFCSIMLALPVAAQSWIWYPGDMDIWMGNKINNLRTERGSFYPAFWQAYSHEQTVEYVKTVELAEAEEVELCVDGHFGVKIRFLLADTRCISLHTTKWLLLHFG